MTAPSLDEQNDSKAVALSAIGFIVAVNALLVVMVGVPGLFVGLTLPIAGIIALTASEAAGWLNLEGDDR